MHRNNQHSSLVTINLKPLYQKLLLDMVKRALYLCFLTFEPEARFSHRCFLGICLGDSARPIYV